MKANNILKAKLFLEENQGYLKWGKEKLADKLNVSIHEIIAAKQMLWAEEEEKEVVVPEVKQIPTSEFDEYVEWKKTKGLSKKPKLPKPFEGGDVENVLVIGDIHEPFSLEGYLEFCRDKQEEYNCGSVVFIGDVIDSHFSSYHETEVCAMGADDELDAAIKKIANWYSVFPEAYVTIGNHDRLVSRKAKTAGLASKWVRGYSEVLNTPNWKFVEEVELYNVCFNHGEAGTARNRMKNELQSQVQGHLHAEAYVDWSVGAKHKVFGMQVGCGVDRSAYAMSYGRIYKKPVISCGVVLNAGTLPILLPMDL
tara:strand:+ start:2976 stop:3905 length:930 start_codon:yes stop_codon:yes gene_type:complete